MSTAPASSGLRVLVLSLLAASAAMALGFAVLMLLGHGLGQIIDSFLIRPFSSARGLEALAVKACPLMLIGVGLALSFRANVWNVGAEGQFIMGALAAGAVALGPVGQAGGAWVLPLVLAAGLGGGMLWALIPALLKTEVRANEILTSLMLVYIAEHVLAWAVIGPLRSPTAYTSPETDLFPPAASLPGVDFSLFDRPIRLHLGVFLAVIVAAGLSVAFLRTLPGFRVRLLGLGPGVMAFHGGSQRRTTWLVLLLSGGLAGLAGAIEAAGPVGQLTLSFNTGYGFTAIIVAFLGRLHPAGAAVAALFLAVLTLGAERVSISLQVPVAVSEVFQALVLLAVLAVPQWEGRRGRPRRKAGGR